MKRNYYKLLGFFLVLLAGANVAQAQCATNTTSGGNCTRSGVFSAQYNADLGCGVDRVITNYSPGTYFRMPVLNGGCYTISTCGNTIDTQIGVFQGTATTNPIAYNDDNGPVCSGTQASVNFVPNFNDYVRVDVRQFSCQAGGSSSITVRIRQNNNLNFTSSSASMCAGQTRALTATPTATTPAYAGSGNGGTFSGTGVSGTTFTAPTPAGASQVYTLTYTFGYCTTTQNITVFANPTTANAGSDQNVACDATTATLAGNTPTIGSGLWTLISGTGTITNPSDPNSGVTGLTPGASSTFRWTITNGPCTASTDDVVISSTTDALAPVPDFAILPDITAECQVAALTPYTATDNCAGTITGTTATTFPITAQGTTVVTWSYDDGNGNISTQTQNVILNDVTDPIALCQNITTYLDGAGNALITTGDIDNGSSDNCGALTLSATQTAFTCADLGANNIILTADDGNGNSATCAAVVTVLDTLSPVAICQDITTYLDGAGNVTITAGDIDGGSSDNCGSVSLSASQTVFTCADIGTNNVTLTVDDGNGNTQTCTSVVTILDTVSPTAVCSNIVAYLDGTGNVSITAGDIDGGSSDNCGSVSLSASQTTFTCADIGTNNVTLTVDDGNGNTSTCSAVVTVSDTTSPTPVVATLADVTAECDVTALTSPTATDNCGGVVTVSNDATLPITAQGTTVVTWTYTDANGNSSTQTQNVVVNNVTAPTPDVATLADVTAECDVTALTSPTATDNCGGVVTVSNDATLPITTQGTTVVTWTYTDANGNSSTQTQNVVITDVSAPVADVATLSDVNGCDSVTTLTAPTATDNCVGSVTGTADVTLPITTPGTTVVTWTYDDGYGNVSTQTQNVIVNVIDDNVTNVNNVLTADQAGATYQWLDCDNGNAPIAGETSQSFSPSANGNYAVEITLNGCVDTSDCEFVDFGLGTHDLESSMEILVYPNPTDGKFNVEIVGLNGGDVELRISDLQGRIVLSEMLEGIAENHIEQVDISNRESGVYVINVIGDNGILVTKRIVKD